jgi:hypothetical protein
MPISRRQFVMASTFTAGFGLAVQPIANSVIQTSSNNLVSGSISIPSSTGGLSSNRTKNRDKERSIISNLLHVMILGYPVTQISKVSSIVVESRKPIFDLPVTNVRAGFFDRRLKVNLWSDR